MLVINKLRSHEVIDHAAQELKKYLRMMMPEGGEVAIFYNPGATDGFRLGLLEDFGLPSEAEDPVLDDVIHVDTTATGGILAGSNLRSVLFAVYRMLRENGCRWLYPGVDGDYVPTVDSLQPVKYHKMADHRFRGFCNEGSESQTCMLECADYYAKLEMNVYMLEWFIPNGYYNRYYSHLHNEKNRIPEEVSDEQVLQWKRQCEVEIAKRGLMLHDIGHGWTCKPFGFPANNNTRNKYDVSGYTDEDKQVLAMLNGKRDFRAGVPIYTNLCMSQDKVRKAVVDGIVEYAETHQNIDYLHVWLADCPKNHCECDECQKMIPSDWYMMMMNELDKALTEKGLDTRVVFIAYVDTMFAPEKIKIENPRRFSLLFAPISRDYQNSITEETEVRPAPKYVRNAWKTPNTDDSYALLKQWQEMWKGTVFFYEYHFWRHQFLDPGMVTFARRVYEDVRSLKVQGVDGYVEDGSQRSGFPNAFPVYIYAETLMNRDCDFDAVMEDYFSHIYGKDWKDAKAILKAISDAFDFGYMEGVKSKNEKISTFYDPERVPQLEKIYELAARERTLAKKHLNMPKRPQTVSWRLLLRHAEYCEHMAGLMIAKAKGQNYKAVELFNRMTEEFGKYELEMETYYDHGLAMRVGEHIIRRPQGIILD